MPTSYIDSNIDHYEPIFSPRDLRGRLPANETIIREVIESRTEIQRIMTGASDRVMLIVGSSLPGSDYPVLNWGGWPKLVHLSWGFRIVRE